VTWQRLHGVSLYDEGLGDHSDPPSPDLLAHRLYGFDGAKWPRLSITIWRSFGEKEPREAPGRGFRVCTAIRPSKSRGWDSYAAFVPYELADELREMIAEVATAAAAQGGGS
jgi:hypothetical protein